MREDGEAPLGDLHDALQRKARRVGKRRGSRTLYESGMPKDSLSAGILKESDYRRLTGPLGSPLRCSHPLSNTSKELGGL
jgi:hypothetical protein